MQKAYPINYFWLGLNSCFMRKQNISKWCRYLSQKQKTKVEKIEEADEIYIWTCAFREDAKQNSLEQIKSIHSLYPSKKMFVCGCLPGIGMNDLKKLCNSGINIIPWRDEEKMLGDIKLYNAVDQVLVAPPLCDNVEEFKKNNPDIPVSFPDQFIKASIAEGCNCDCAYCSEKLAFPQYKSFPENYIVKQCEAMVQKFHKYEIMLLADSLGEYGYDIGTSLPHLMESIYAIDPQIKIALNNFHPKFFIKYQDYLVEKLKQNKIRHINIPIQSACDSVLSRMNRDYTKAEITKIFNIFNSMGFVEFDTHLLVGYDGETEENFNETLDFIIAKCPKYVLASIYMDTPENAKRNQDLKIAPEMKKQRMRLLEQRLRKEAKGIIVNCDGNALSNDRWRRLNSIKGEK